jgi:hypothetical protein
MISQATVVGRLDPPGGRTWEELLVDPGARAALLLDFQIAASRALGVPAGRVSIQAKPQAIDMEKATRKPGRWHTDSYGGLAHVVCVVGDRPTEFLLGPYERQEVLALLQSQDLSAMEGEVRVWSPGVGDIVRIDPGTIHRRPVLSRAPRLFLLGNLRVGSGAAPPAS